MTKLFITPHAQGRIRERFGIESVSTMVSWASAKVLDGRLVKVQPDGRKVYHWGHIELVVSADGQALITAVDLSIEETYAEKFLKVVEREARKLLTVKERSFRKAEIHVAEVTLNMLKARNPKIKASLNEKLTRANAVKTKLASEIHVIKKTAKGYGVNV